MAKDQNFENNGHEFNVHLDTNGNLAFNDNGKNGAGNTRMIIFHNKADVTIGGSGEFGQLQLRAPTGEATIFLGGTETEARAVLGGQASGQSGLILLYDSSGSRAVKLEAEDGLFVLGDEGKFGHLHIKDHAGIETIKLEGDESSLQLFSSTGGKRVDLLGDSEGAGRLQLFSSTGGKRVDLHGESSDLLGDSEGAGRLELFNPAGRKRADLQGDFGRLELFNISGAVSADLRGDGAGVLELGSNISASGSAKDISISCNGNTRQLKIFSASEATATLEMFSASGDKSVDLRGDGHLYLLNSNGGVTGTPVELHGHSGTLYLGGNGTDGDILIRDRDGNFTITCHGNNGDIECLSLSVLDGQGNSAITCAGDTGLIECVSLTERPIPEIEGSDGLLKTNIAQVMNALDSVLALRGVRYQRTQVTEPTAAAAGEAQQIGFVGEELEAVCPELVTTDAKGRKSVSYSRMTVVLVEAIKEQQQLIRDQAAALDEALRKISAIEAGLASHR